MTGLPTLLVELDDGTGAFPYDITAYVDMRVGWSMDRGRRDEFSEVDPASARLTLNNRDGRFTLGSAAYGIFVEQQIRITETFGAGSASKRITGNVQDWPVEYTDPGALNVPCSIRLMDRQARLTRRTLDDVFATELLADDPGFLYMLGEESGATAAGDTSGVGNRALTIQGTGTAPTFGSVGTVDNTGVTFAAGGRYLQGPLATPAEYKTFGITLVTTTTTATADVLLARLESTTDPTNSVTLYMTAAGQAMMRIVVGTVPTDYAYGPTINDGLPHRITFRFNSSTGALGYAVDGAEVTGALGAGWTPFTSDRLTIGGNAEGSVTILAVAGYSTYLSAGRVAEHYTAQGTLTADSSDERIARLAGYAGLGPSDLALEVGLLTSVAQQSTTGVSVWSAISDVDDAEGGVVFIRGDGKLVLQNRTHRARVASSAYPSLLLDGSGGDIEHEDFRVACDTQYLTNIARGSRPDGAQQTYKSDTSIAKYEAYPQDLSSLLVTTDDEVFDRLVWAVDTYDEVVPRVNSVTVDLLTITSNTIIQGLLALELGGRIEVTGLPSTSPVTDADLIVEGFSEKQTVNEWSITLNTVAADLYRVWVLEDTAYGVLGSTTRLHY